MNVYTVTARFRSHLGGWQFDDIVVEARDEDEARLVALDRLTNWQRKRLEFLTIDNRQVAPILA